MPRYLISIYHNEAAPPNWSEAQVTEYHRIFGEYMQTIQKSGMLLRMITPMPSATATTLQWREGKAVISDALLDEKMQPYTYYLLDCKDFGEVMTLATRTPLASNWSVEIRPVIDVEQLT